MAARGRGKGMTCDSTVSRRLPPGRSLRDFGICLLRLSRQARGRRDARAHAGVSEIARSPHRPRAGRARVSLGRRTRTATTCKAMGGPRAQRIGAAEHRRFWVGACTHALRELTHRVCSNATSAASGVSYAVRPKGEEHREPAAQRRASLCAAHAARPSPCERHGRVRVTMQRRKRGASRRSALQSTAPAWVNTSATTAPSLPTLRAPPSPWPGCRARRSGRDG
jgi:hypothetical protein